MAQCYTTSINTNMSDIMFLLMYMRSSKRQSIKLNFNDILGTDEDRTSTIMVRT